VLVHVCVITLVAALSWWHQQKQPEPLKRITVSMISAQELAKMQHQQSKKNIPPAPVKTKKPGIKPEPPKPAIKPKPIDKPKPVPTVKAEPKPAVKPTPAKTAPKKKIDENYDPFAPIASSGNQKTVKKPSGNTTTQNDMSTIISKQLSSKELDRYIAMMQAAVQQQWKVPASISNSAPDPLVELHLSRNGHVQSIRILESSGNTALDESLIAAIRAAAPFELPEMQYQAFMSNKLRFHPLK